MSLITRIFMLIALTLLVVAGGELFNGLKLRQERIDEARIDSIRLAHIAELDMNRILEGSHQLLAALAKLPVDHGWDERGCSLIEATASSDFEYDHLAAVDRNGIIQCSSSGATYVGTPIPDAELLHRILVTGGFAVGSYGVGRLSGNEVIRVGYPVVDAAGAVVGAVYAGINVTWLNTAISQWQLGSTASIIISDSNGIVIARHPDPQRVGQPISDNLKDFLTAADVGFTEVMGADGVARLYGYEPIEAGPSSDLAVFVGRDQAAISADIERSIWLNAAIVLIGLLLSALIAVIFVRRFLTRPFERLLTTVGRWRDGDWSVRVNAATGIPEFDRLSLAFDGMAEEVSAREAKIRRMARYDFLTGLANRAVFVEAVEREIAETRRGAKGFAVLYLDLDHFKDVNDTLGHPIGDQLLMAVAERLKSGMRETDIVARFGGDEFAVVATDILEPVNTAVLADRALQAINTPFSIEGNEIRIGTSIGIAVYGSDSPDAESLLSHADLALYRAKADGRGTYRFFTDAMDSEVRARVSLEAELRTAIGAKQFFLVYQPQVDINTGGIVGLEALVRWRHPTRGIVSPGQFIPVAEKSGLIVALGHWVMHEACRQMRLWLDLGIAPPLIAVNLSGEQFKTPRELENDIRSTLAETNLPAERLELELTESILMGASLERNDVLLRLQKTGLRVAIDDFGTGYSSLDYLHRFPVDRIKIAQNFIVGLTASSGAAAIVRASIGLAHELKLGVVVEGVETTEQLELVRSWGCQVVQGHLFSKASPADKVTALLRRGKITLARSEAYPEAAIA